jgi:uncharacterized protein YeaO (DUF488 family)
MAIRIVRLGTDRHPNEGVRIGTVRRPPRGVRKADYASKNFYDLWLPMLAPTPDLVKLALGAKNKSDWDCFAKQYRKEMSATDPNAVINAFAALSHQADFSMGCYCANEDRCHRSILRELLCACDARII